jgi:hypothetical protein
VTHDESLATEYADRLHALVRKSFLSHAHIAAVLTDMLESDMVMLWQLIGGPMQSEVFEEMHGDFMTRVQRAANDDPTILRSVKAAIRAELAAVEGHLHLQ